MDKLEIKPLKKEYIKEVLVIEEESFNNPWSKAAFAKELKNKYGYYIVGLIGGKVVSYLGAWLFLNKAHITNLAISSNYRREGLATKLLTQLFKKLSQEGIVIVTLEVRISNQAAKNLYRSLGFVKIGIKKEYYSDNNEDAIVMWKRLKSSDE